MVTLCFLKAAGARRTEKSSKENTKREPVNPLLAKEQPRPRRAPQTPLC